VIEVGTFRAFQVVETVIRSVAKVEVESVFLSLTLIYAMLMFGRFRLESAKETIKNSADSEITSAIKNQLVELFNELIKIQGSAQKCMKRLVMTATRLAIECGLNVRVYVWNRMRTNECRLSEQALVGVNFN